jgi:hypothetical protein
MTPHQGEILIGIQSADELSINPPDKASPLMWQEDDLIGEWCYFRPNIVIVRPGRE